MIGWLRALYFWPVTVIVTIVCFVVLFCGSLLMKVLRIPNPDRFAHYMSGVWARTLIHSVPSWRVTISGRENLPASDDKPVVIVANHQSMADIWAIYCINSQFRWLAKIEVFKTPLVGTAMKWAGYVPVKRGDPLSHATALKQSAEWLQRGTSMFFFPEGTRSETGEIRLFKICAFRFANENNVKVLPIAITGAHQLLPKGSFVPGSAHVKIKVLPATGPLADESLEAYAERVRQTIQQAVDSLK